jgi:hypothetical protein
MKFSWAIGLVLLAPVAALAQDSASSRIVPSARDMWGARDGCENIPGQAHNSADCSRIDRLDPDDVVPNKPISAMSGAELNMLRNQRILSATAGALEVVRSSSPQLTDAAVEGMIKLMATPTVAGNRIPRWTEGLCVKTQGLTPELNAAMDRRIRQVAAMVGAPVADVPCDLNVAVLFEADPPAALKEMAQANPLLFANSDNVATMRRPVQAWYVSMTEDLRGNVRPDVPNAPELCETVDTNIMEVGGGPLQGVQVISQARMRQALTDMARYCGARYTNLNRTKDGVKGLGFSVVTVVASAELLKDYPVATLADHIALLALSRVSDSDVCQPVQTVANLFKESCSPGARSTAITASDLAFLVALYRAVQRDSAVLQIGSIAGEMKRALDGR